MEPKLSGENSGAEIPTVIRNQSNEQLSQNPSFEAGLNQSVERFEQRAETNSPSLSTSGPILPTPIIDNNVSTQSPSSDVNVAVDNSNPIIANDDDLIEKEWVDKAKKIIQDTKDNPYLREQEVNKLQADYLRKRYGRELGTS
jgi:hypothetical protein